MIDGKTADMIGTWLSNQLQSHSDDLSDELKGSEDGTLKVAASIAFRRIAGTKYGMRCKFSIPRQSIVTEDVFDLQLNLPGM
jgi:hypothetical protein